MADKSFLYKNIYTLLIEGFSEEELRRICHDIPDFHPVYDQLARSSGKAEIIRQLIDYAERHVLIEELLLVARESNPASYARHQPYYETVKEPYYEIPKKLSESKSRSTRWPLWIGVVIAIISVIINILSLSDYFSGLVTNTPFPTLTSTATRIPSPTPTSLTTLTPTFIPSPTSTPSLTVTPTPNSSFTSFLIDSVLPIVVWVMAGIIVVGAMIFFRLHFFTWMLIIFVLTRGKKRVPWLRYLPPRFDKHIIIPLPFMAKLIEEAYLENPTATQQMISYLLDSTNQQQVASHAMAKITASVLEQCETLGDIATVADQLAWIPASLPEESFDLKLRTFLDVSQGVRAALAVTSLYTRCELLSPPIAYLRRLQDDLVLDKNIRLMVAFDRIAEQWLSILEAAQQTLGERAHQSMEIPQVYIAGPALDPDRAETRFKGRKDVAKEIENLVLSPQPPVLLLHGGRRTGKTSVLKYLPRLLGSELVPLLIDIQGAASATTLNGLAENLAAQMSEAARRSRGLRLPKPDPDKWAIDPFQALQNWLDIVEQDQTVKGKRFLLCLDEFERLTELVETTHSRAPLNFLRHLLQHHPQWILLFSGSHTLAELPNYWSDYLINTRTLHISFLEEKDARELIVQPVPNFPNIYKDEAVDAIIQLTHCQPFLVQLVCYEMVLHLNREKKQRATSQDVEAIVDTALEYGANYFRDLWYRGLSKEERDLLLRFSSKESTNDLERELFPTLVQKEILEKTKTGYCFQVPLVQMFIERVVIEQGFPP